MNSQNNEDFINLLEIFKTILNYKKTIFSGIFISGIVSVLIAISTPNIYVSSAILKPQDDYSSANPISSSMGGLASIAGIELSADYGDKGMYAIETIRSKIFFKHLVELDSELILPSLMALDSYNLKSNTLIFNEKIYNQKNKKWVRDVKVNQSQKPSYIEAHEYFLSILEIFKDKKTGYIYISISHQSPVFAHKLLQLIISEVNNITRNRENRESTDAINYLVLKESSSNLNSLKSSINNLIESQLQKQMISSIREEFLLKTIDPPIIPEKKFSPNRVFICVMGVFLGFFTSIFSVLIFHILKYKSLQISSNRHSA